MSRSTNHCPPHLRHRFAAPFPPNVHRTWPPPPAAAAAAAAAPYSYGYFPLHYRHPDHQEIISRLQYHTVAVYLSPVYLPTHNNPNPRFHPIPVHHHHQEYQNSNNNVYPYHHSIHQLEDETLILDSYISDNIFTSRSNGGLSEETIVKNLKKRAPHEIRVAADYQQEVCVVCQDDLFGETESVATLPCGHDYHSECIKNWLLQKNECPICKAKALVVDS